MAEFDAGATTAAARAKIRTVSRCGCCCRRPGDLFTSFVWHLYVGLAGDFLRVSAGTRTSCALHAKSNSADPDSVSTTIHCWGSRSNALLDHLVVEKKNGGNSYGHEQISLGNDHACVAGKKADESSESAQAQLECWWMAGSDFNAHRVPFGLEMVG